MKIGDYINLVQREFELGKSFVELHSPERTERFRKRLYRAARRRGLLWMFSICDQSLFVRQ